MTAILEALTALWHWLSQNWAAVAVILFNIEEKRVDEAKNKEEKEALDLSLEKNKEIIAAKYSNRSDRDIISDALKSAEPGSDPSKPKSDS